MTHCKNSIKDRILAYQFKINSLLQLISEFLISIFELDDTSYKNDSTVYLSFL